MEPDFINAVKTIALVQGMLAKPVQNALISFCAINVLPKLRSTLGRPTRTVHPYRIVGIAPQAIASNESETDDMSRGIERAGTVWA